MCPHILEDTFILLSTLLKVAGIVRNHCNTQCISHRLSGYRYFSDLAMANHGFEAVVVFFYLKFTVSDKPSALMNLAPFPQLLHTNNRITGSNWAAFFYYLSL
jgi:hypothetical protein